MTERELERRAQRRQAVLRHVEEVSFNVAATCRYYGISRQCYYGWLRWAASRSDPRPTHYERFGSARPGGRRPGTAARAGRMVSSPRIRPDRTSNVCGLCADHLGSKR